jgi:hypothetical protein
MVRVLGHLDWEQPGWPAAALSPISTGDAQP